MREVIVASYVCILESLHGVLLIFDPHMLFILYGNLEVIFARTIVVG